jgi:hypothetical protein
VLNSKYSKVKKALTLLMFVELLNEKHSDL